MGKSKLARIIAAKNNSKSSDIRDEARSERGGDVAAASRCSSSKSNVSSRWKSTIGGQSHFDMEDAKSFVMNEMDRRRRQETSSLIGGELEGLHNGGGVGGGAESVCSGGRVTNAALSVLGVRLKKQKKRSLRTAIWKQQLIAQQPPPPVTIKSRRKQKNRPSDKKISSTSSLCNQMEADKQREVQLEEKAGKPKDDNEEEEEIMDVEQLEQIKATPTLNNEEENELKQAGKIKNNRKLRNVAANKMQDLIGDWLASNPYNTVQSRNGTEAQERVESHQIAEQNQAAKQQLNHRRRQKQKTSTHSSAVMTLENVFC